MFIVLRPCDSFPDVSSVALTFVLFVWRCLPIGVSVLTLSLKSGEGMTGFFVLRTNPPVPGFEITVFVYVSGKNPSPRNRPPPPRPCSPCGAV